MYDIPVNDPLFYGMNKLLEDLEKQMDNEGSPFPPNPILRYFCSYTLKMVELDRLNLTLMFIMCKDTDINIVLEDGVEPNASVLHFLAEKEKKAAEKLKKLKQLEEERRKREMDEEFLNFYESCSLGDSNSPIEIAEVKLVATGYNIESDDEGENIYFNIFPNVPWNPHPPTPPQPSTHGTPSSSCSADPTHSSASHDPCHAFQDGPIAQLCYEESDEIPPTDPPKTPRRKNFAKRTKKGKKQQPIAMSLIVGMVFDDKERLREILTDFCVQEKFNMKTVKAESNRYTVKCADKKWRWRVHATPIPDDSKWLIKTMQPLHSCKKLLRSRMAGVRWLTTHLLEDVRANPNVEVAELVVLADQRFQEKVPVPTMYKVKAAALRKIQG